MDNVRIGATKTAAGNIKRSVGKVFRDRKTIADGKAEATGEKVQNAIGGIRDTIPGKAKPSPSPVPARLPEISRQYRAPADGQGSSRARDLRQSARRGSWARSSTGSRSSTQ